MTTMTLAASEIEDFLAKAGGAVMVKISADWCVPCRLAAPVMRKLQREFAVHMTLVEIDGDTARDFRRVHDVRSIPEVLVFRDGKLTGRVSGYPGAEKLRTAVAAQLGVSLADEASAAELAFRDAEARAVAAFDGATKPFLEVVRAHHAEIEPEIEAMEERIAADVEAGRISGDEARARTDAEYDRLEAPFKDKIEALETAMSEALSAYDAAMSEAAGEFGREAAPATGAARGMCLPGSGACSLGEAAA